MYPYDLITDVSLIVNFALELGVAVVSKLASSTFPPIIITKS